MPGSNGCASASPASAASSSPSRRSHRAPRRGTPAPRASRWSAPGSTPSRVTGSQSCTTDASRGPGQHRPHRRLACRRLRRRREEVQGPTGPARRGRPVPSPDRDARRRWTQLLEARRRGAQAGRRSSAPLSTTQLSPSPGCSASSRPSGRSSGAPSRPAACTSSGRNASPRSWRPSRRRVGRSTRAHRRRIGPRPHRAGLSSCLKRHRALPQTARDGIRHRI